MAVTSPLLETQALLVCVSSHLLCIDVHAFVVKRLHVEVEENLSLPSSSWTIYSNGFLPTQNLEQTLNLTVGIGYLESISI